MAISGIAGTGDAISAFQRPHGLAVALCRRIPVAAVFAAANACAYWLAVLAACVALQWDLAPWHGFVRGNMQALTPAGHSCEPFPWLAREDLNALAEGAFAEREPNHDTLDVLTDESLVESVSQLPEMRCIAVDRITFAGWERADNDSET